MPPRPATASTGSAPTQTHLSDVVRFDLPLLGDVAGLEGVHLQCHIGTDTISLARLGARMTGLDFSPASLAEARRLAEETGADVRFVESELYAATDVLGEGRFDLVFTGIGALCWLPDISRWGDVVSRLLRPGGRLFMRESHPVLWTLDDRRPGGLAIEYPYFETAEPLVWDEPGTYVETDVEFTQNVTHEWNHGLGEILTALLAGGMELTGLVEHTSVPYEALPGQMEDVGGGEWRLRDRPERLPHTYTLQARQARLIVRAASIDRVDHRPWSKPHARAWATPQPRSRSRSIPRSASASSQRRDCGGVSREPGVPQRADAVDLPFADEWLRIDHEPRLALGAEDVPCVEVLVDEPARAAVDAAEHVDRGLEERALERPAAVLPPPRHLLHPALGLVRERAGKDERSAPRRAVAPGARP